jgi:ABC-type lipoprotein export system ATPase subunit
MIRVRELEKSYLTPAGQTWVLRRIDLDLRAGEFVTIMGPSGAGKSTLLGILGLLDADWSGEYHLLDQPVHQLSRKERTALARRTVGFVFQSYHLLDDLTVYENLDLPLGYKDIGRRERASLVCDALDRFGLVGKKDLYPSQLSGGQQQLVGVARAVISNPPLLLADEPTGNLHSGQAREIMELFCELNARGTTIVQVSHAASNAAYGHRVVQLLDGWLVREPAA